MRSRRRTRLFWEDVPSPGEALGLGGPATLAASSCRAAPEPCDFAPIRGNLPAMSLNEPEDKVECLSYDFGYRT